MATAASPRSRVTPGRAWDRRTAGLQTDCDVGRGWARWYAEIERGGKGARGRGDDVVVCKIAKGVIDL